MTSASPAVPRGVSAVSGGLSLLTIVLAFETPDTTLLAVSALLVFTFPLAALWHLAATRTLTRAEKRLWLRELTGAEAFSAMSDYVRSPDLRATAQRRAKVRPKA
jgi:hypothetical protein